MPYHTTALPANIQARSGFEHFEQNMYLKVFVEKKKCVMYSCRQFAGGGRDAVLWMEFFLLLPLSTAETSQAGEAA